MSVARNAFPLFATTSIPAKNTVIPFPYFATAQRIPSYFDPKSFVVAVANHIFILYKVVSIQSSSTNKYQCQIAIEKWFFFFFCWQYLLNEGRKEMPPIVIRFTFIGFSSVFARILVRVYVFQWKIFASGRIRPIQIIRCKKLFVRCKCWFTDSFRFIKPQMDPKSIT